MEKQCKDGATAISFHYAVDVDYKWFGRQVNGDLRKTLDGKTAKFIEVIVSNNSAAIQSDSYTALRQFDTGAVTFIDHARRSYKRQQCPARNAKKEDNPVWKVKRDAGRVRLRAGSVHLEAKLTDHPDINPDAARAVWMLLFPGLSAKQTPTALPSHLLMLDTEGKKRLGLDLRKTRTTTKLPEEVFSHYKPLEPAKNIPVPQWKPGPAKGGSRGDSLKNDARRSRRRHRVRGQAVDAAWMLKQEVLDQARDLVNAIGSKLSEFTSPKDGSLGIHLDLFPQLEPIFEAANYDDVPSVASWEDLSRNNLYPAMTLLEIYNGRTPVRANQAAGGMTRAESRRYLDWISGAISSGVYADRIERVLSFIGSRVFRGASAARRRREVGKAQLQVLLDQKIVARDADDRPITGISGNVPDTDEEWRLMRYELSNFKLKLDFNGNDIIDRFELVDGHVELDMRIPQLSMGANFSTNGLASALGISLNFLTAGAFAIWLDNSGHWAAHLRGRLAFDLIPEVTGDSPNETVDMRVVYNGERSDFIWTADPLISENPFNTEIFWLIALFAERIFDYSGEWDDEIANLVAEKLDEGIAEALRWPDLWHALHGPRTNGVSPHFDDENAHWKSSLVPSAFRVPTGAATSLDSEFAKPMAMAVSHRYIDSWLMNCITAEHGSFPYNTPISPEDLARSFGQQLPNPASIQADDPAAEPPPFDPFMNVGQTRCPDPPSPPPPQTVYEAGMVRSEPRISLPTTEQADYVADFEIDYWLRISAIRTWEIPVFSSSGYDCIPPGGLDLIDPGVLPFDPQDIFSRLDRDIFDFARVNFDQFATSFTNNLAVGGQMQSFSGGGSIPIPGGPTPGIPTPGTDVPGLPDQQTGHCAIECTWSFEPERRNIITPLQVHGRIRGKLMLDFDPDFYGEESKGILQGPIPGIRLSVVNEPASDRPGSAALEGEILGVMTDSVFTSVPEDQIRNACLERFMANAHDLLDGLVFVDSPRLKMPLVPKNRAIERLPLDTIVAVFEWARSLIVLQHPSDDGNPTYNIDGNMVYFSVELVEGVTAFVDGNDSD